MRFYDPGNCLEVFVHNVERVESIGSVFRVVLCVPKGQERETVNEVVLTLLVPAEQLAGMVAKLMQTPSKSITCNADVGDEVRH